MTDLFADKAREWDSMPVPQAISAGVGRAILERVPLSPDMKVMDFGAGTGLVASRVAPHVDRIWAVDVSASMLDKLAAKPEFEGRIVPICQDILAEPLDRAFDLIVSAMAMHHIPDTAALIGRFAEHLLPGGRLALADLDAEDGSFHPPGTEGVFHHGFAREALAELLAGRGLVEIEVQTALEVLKEGRRYPIFLATARKP